jgi:hypothetical protein
MYLFEILFIPIVLLVVVFPGHRDVCPDGPPRVW